jgi:hypothetical protein
MGIFRRKKKKNLEKIKDKVLFWCGIAWILGGLLLFVTSTNSPTDINLLLSGLYFCIGILNLILAYKYKK